MDNPNPIRYADLVTPDDSITKLIGQLEALIAKYDEAKGKIQSAAVEAAKSMQSLSGATEDQRKAIALTTEESDRLVARYRDVTSASWKATQAFAEANAAKRESAQVDKLITQINTSLEGSYNRLSAQYRLNKIRLNEMSEAERQGTESGRKLEAETRAIYSQMNELQKSTGKYTLQVGNYERALGGALGVNSRFLSILTDTSKATDTLRGVMNTLTTPVGVVIGLAGAATAAFKLWRASIHETQQMGDEFDLAMAGWKAGWDRFRQAVSAVDFSNFIRGVKDAIIAGRNLQATLDELFEERISTRLLRASMSQEIAGYEEAARNASLSYAERKQAAENYLNAMAPIYQQQEEQAKKLRDRQLEYLFDTTNRRKFASEEEKQAAREQFAENLKNFNLNEDLIKQANEYVKAQKKIAETTRLGGVDPREQFYRQTIENTSEGAKAFADFARQYQLTNDRTVEAYVKAEEEYQSARVAIYNDNKRMVTLMNNLGKQETDEARRNAQERAKAAQQEAKERQKAAEDAAKAQEQAAKEAAKAAEEARQKEIAERRAELQFQIQSTQMQIATTEEGTDEMLRLRIEAIQKQRDLELFENRQKAEKLQQDEALIRAKYDAQILKTTADFETKRAQRELAASQDLADAEFNLLNRNERKKTLFRIQQEIVRLEKVLEINETASEKMTETEVAAVRATIEGLKKEAGELGYNNLWELLGIDLSSPQQSALETAIDSVKSSIESLADSWAQAAEAAVQAADKQVEAAQKVLDAEIEARNAGYANSVETAQKELALAQSNREKALREQERAQRAQMHIDSLTQASSLITASANIWKAFSGGGLLGMAAAVAAIATMWGSFAAAKVRAYQVTRNTEQYGEGTVELLEGGSHASGHDIDLGVKKDGMRRRAEGGEFFAVINKRNSRRYRDVIPDVINSFNNGTFAERYQRANAAMAGYAVSMIGGGTDVSSIERDVAAIRKQGDESRTVDGQGNVVIRYKNLTRKIKS